MTDFFVRLGGSTETPTSAHILEVGKNLASGEADFAKAFDSPTSLELDLLRLAGAIFAADRASERGLDTSYQRTLSVSAPVVNFSRLSPLALQVERILRKLSDDRWKIVLRPNTDSQPESQTFPQSGGTTLLFSGGLDSLAAAVEFGKQEATLQLVSHTTKNSVTTTSQRALVKELRKNGHKLSHQQFFVSSTDAPPGGFDHDIESSQRTRSFVFLVLGALAARRTGHSSLLMLAENGQMAIHLPLTTGRIGALSTHTAHPDVLALMATFLTAAMSYPITIRNPYLYKTKAEAIHTIVKSAPSTIPMSTSCWRNTKIPPPATHCGQCVPCYVRRIALESFGKDPTKYAQDVWSKDVASLPEDDDGRRNLMDLAEFVKRFEAGTNDDLIHEFPELYSSNIVANDALDMYRRFAKEARSVLSAYPNLNSILA